MPDEVEAISSREVLEGVYDVAADVVNAYLEETDMEEAIGALVNYVHQHYPEV